MEKHIIGPDAVDPDLHEDGDEWAETKERLRKFEEMMDRWMAGMKEKNILPVRITCPCCGDESGGQIKGGWTMAPEELEKHKSRLCWSCEQRGE